MIVNNKAGIKGLLENRRDLYLLFSRFFRCEVDESFLAAVKNIEFPIYEENDITNFNASVTRLKDYFDYDAGESMDDLAADYAKTFLAAGNSATPAAFPYESVYTGPKKIMMQDAWNQVCDIYAEKGIECDKEVEDLIEDHIALELQFMAFLCEETIAQTEMIAGLEEQKEFLTTHLLNWVPTFCLDVENYADTEFYRMVAELTSSFLQMDSYILDKMLIAKKTVRPIDKSVKMNKKALDEVISKLKEEYHVYAPVLLPDRGPKGKNGIVRYDEINSVDEMIIDRQSDYSPKEIVFPISQTVFTFDENDATETIDKDPKGIIIIARPCDINGMKRLDNMYLANGQIADAYYKRLRDKTKLFMLECESSFEHCYCVSMGTNKTDNYSLALRIKGDDISIKIKDSDFEEYFENAADTAYEPSFIEDNKTKINIPNINSSNLKQVFELEFWKSYNDRCISCGGCNTVCPTCSCFDSIDHLNQENSKKGERKRVWSSCMLQDYSKTAGGNVVRKMPDTMMRFKTMHKVYDYKKRFGGNENMCVGCGRCILGCPEDISFGETINTLYDEVEKLNASNKVEA